MPLKKTAKSTARKKTPARKPGEPTKASSKPVESIDVMIEGMKPPFREALETVRRIILSVDSSIQEGVKWNSPSFRTADWFATVNLRGKGGEERVWLILHAGAKAGPDLQKSVCRYGRDRLAEVARKGPRTDHFR